MIVYLFFGGMMFVNLVSQVIGSFFETLLNLGANLLKVVGITHNKFPVVFVNFDNDDKSIT